MTSESYNEEYELNHTQASNVLETDGYNGYPELNSDRQNKRNKHEIDQASDALKVGYDDYANMALKVETTHERNAYLNEEPNLDMSIISYYSSDDRITVPFKNLDDADYFIGSNNKTSAESTYECLIETDTVIEKTRAQRTLSSMKEVLKQRSDDQRRGRRVGSDVRGAESTEIMRVNHEHKKNIINETEATNNAIRINESMTVISTFFKNLKARSYGLIPYIIKEDHEITTSEAKLEVVETTGASSSGNYGTSLSKDRIRRDTHEDPEDKMQICIFSQDVPKDEAIRSQTREDVSRSKLTFFDC